MWYQELQWLLGSRFATNMISTVTNQGKVRFMLYRETLTAPVLTHFLARLLRDAGKKVFLILDNLKVHHSKKVRAWLADPNGAIPQEFSEHATPGKLKRVRSANDEKDWRHAV